MQIQNKKTVQKISILASLLVVILLLAGFLFSLPLSAKAEETDEVIYKIPTNFTDVYLDCERVISGQFSTCTTLPLDSSLGYELVSLNWKGSPPSWSDIVKNINGTYSFGGSGSPTFDPGQFVIATLKKVIPLPEIPTKEGHTFTGWYLDETCKTPYAGEPITEDLTLYAGWQINTYIVTFDSAGGSAIATITTNWNTSITTQTPTKTGYTFSGWYNGGAKYNGEPIKANTTLTATWEPIILTVTFKVDNEVYKTLQVPYGTSLTEALEAAKLTEYTLNFINFDSGYIGQENLADFIITDNGSIDAAPLADGQKVINLIQQFWLLGLLTIIVVALLLTIPGRKKKKSV